MSLQNLKRKILGREQKETTEDDLVTAHDILMVEYGWIPLEEFRTLPIPTMINLINCINKRRKAEKKAMEKSNRKR